MTKKHHPSMLETLFVVFVVLILLAGIIFVMQFRAQAGEAGRLIRTDIANSVSKAELQRQTQITIGGEIKKPTIGGSAWEDAEKRGMLVDPGYGLPDFDGFDNIIIINDGEEKPKLVLYDPRWHNDLIDLFKPRKPAAPKPPVPPSLEELGRIIHSKYGGYTCYYDENGNFVRAWRMSRSGQNVEINEDPNGNHGCPKTVQVKKIEPTPTLPPPVVDKPSGAKNSVTGDYVDVNTLNMIPGGLYACYYDSDGKFVQAIKGYANHDLIVLTNPPMQCPASYSG